MRLTQIRRRGIALFEVVLAAVLLGIGLTVALSTAATALSHQTLGEHNMVAAWLADEQMNLVVMEGPQQYLRAHPTSGFMDSPFDAYSFDVEVQHVGDWEPYEVTVLISWDEGDRTFQLQSLVAPRQGVPLEFDDHRPLEPIDREAIYFEENIE